MPFQAQRVWSVECVLHVPPNQAGTQQLSPDSGVVVLERTSEYS